MGDVQGSSIVGVNYPRRKLCRCNCPRWELSGAIVLGGNYPGGTIVQGGIVLFPMIQGQFPTGQINCPLSNCLGGNLPRWDLSVGGLSGKQLS